MEFGFNYFATGDGFPPVKVEPAAGQPAMFQPVPAIF